MMEIAAPVAFAAVFWWLSTGIILWLMGRPRSTYRWSAGAATLLAVVSTLALVGLRDRTGVVAAYAGFTIGVLLWAWHEVMFLLGYVSGSRKTPLPPGLPPMSRFVASTQAIIHHELIIAGHAVLIAALSWGAANQFGALTFFLLWAMRLSAKLVIFFGAPNVSDHFLPPHLEYLGTYFKKERASAFFPLAFAICAGIAAALAAKAMGAAPGGFEAVGYVLLTSLAALALIEHLALVLPVPDAALWAGFAGWAARHPEPAKAKAIVPEWRN